MTSRKNQYAYKTEHLTKEILESDYSELKSVRKLAAKHNVHHKTMSQLLNKFNINFNPKLTRTKNENIFSEETETSFYLAGFIAADGNISNFKKNYHLHIGLSENDEEHLINIQKLFNSNSNIRTYKNNSYINKRNIKSTIKAFTICSKQIFNDLIKNFNITPNKSLTLKFPKHLINHSMIHHFIRGYFDGDGSWTIRNPNQINKQSKINIGFDITGTENFINNIQNILNANIALPPNKISMNKNIYRLRYSGNKLSSLIGDWMYNNATIYLNRKYERYKLAKSLMDSL